MESFSLKEILPAGKGASLIAKKSTSLFAKKDT
jgi:hypothetical protein